MASKDKTKTLNLIFTIVAVVLIVIIVPLLAISVTLIIKGSIDPDNPPSIFGYAPLTVASGSMEGTNDDSFDEGDLIFVKVLSDDEKQQLQELQVICYTVDDIYVTHRITSITYNDDGTIASLITKGDANDTYDSAITVDDIFGLYTGRIKGLGSFAEFLQSAGGIAVFVGIPVVAFIVFDVSRLIILNQNKKKEQRLQSTEEALQSKEEEIARLKQMLSAQNTDGGAAESGQIAAAEKTESKTADDANGGGKTEESGEEKADEIKSETEEASADGETKADGEAESRQKNEKSEG